MFELEGYTMPDFPARDEGQYPIAMVSLDSSGGCAYLTFADKAGYIKKLIAGDVWTGNAYTLGLTPEDTYDESKVIYEQSYVVMLDEAYKDALELLYPGITTTAWLRYTPPSTQTPSGGYYSLAMNYGPQWTNTDLYDEDGNLFLSAAGKKFPLREWLSWRIYGLCSRPLPMGQKQDVLDNEWPIEWTTLEVANNLVRATDNVGTELIKISNLTATIEEATRGVLTATAKVNGVTFECECVGTGAEETPSSTIMDMWILNTGDITYYVFLGYATIAGTDDEGINYPETGLYFAVFDTTFTPVSPDSIDLQLKLSLPVAYLYNGVRLPGLPESDRQYAVIAQNPTSSIFYVRFEEAPVTVSETGGKLFFNDGYTYKLVDGAWQSGAASVNHSVIWSNHDINYSDEIENMGGTLYLAASDPVPVYE